MGIAKDGLLPVGSDRNNFDGFADQFGNSFDVSFCVDRKFLVICDLCNFFFPTGQCFVNRHGVSQIAEIAGEILDILSVDFVGGADLEGIEAAENIKEHDCEGVNSAESCGIADGNRVEPAATSGAFCYGAVFIAVVTDLFTGFVILFGGKRTAADAGGVCFDDTDNFFEEMGRHTASGGDTGTAAVAAGYVGEGSVVDIQQGTLGAFEEDRFIGIDGVEEVICCIGDIRLELFGVFGIFFVDGFGVQFHIETGDSHGVVAMICQSEKQLIFNTGDTFDF